MNSYIIRLSDFSNSVKWSEETFLSGIKHNWKIEYFEGINGQRETLKDYNIKINSKYKKSVKAFSRPGTVGCFLSHYKLWEKCIELSSPICILEHDVIIKKPLITHSFEEILKLIKGPETKGSYLGDWWASGAAYCITPNGAKKLIDFVTEYGAMPADIMLNTGIVKIEFDQNNIAEIDKKEFSFTWEL